MLSFKLMTLKTLFLMAIGLFCAFLPTYSTAFPQDTVRIESQAGGDETRLATFELRENPIIARRDSLIALARTFLGRPYVWGGTTPYGFDCSGFAWYLFRQFGYNLHRMSGDQATQGSAVKIEDAQPGDVVLYGYPYGTGYIYTHTAIVYARDSQNNVTVIHSSLLGLAITALHFDPNYTCRFVCMRRIIE